MAEAYESFAVPDTFCERLVRIDTLGPCRRLVFATRENSGGELTLVISAKLILSAEAMIEIGRMMQAGAPEFDPLATFEPSSRRAN
jgi:hypothetical protein